MMIECFLNLSNLTFLDEELEEELEEESLPISLGHLFFPVRIRTVLMFMY